MGDLPGGTGRSGGSGLTNMTRPEMVVGVMGDSRRDVSSLVGLLDPQVELVVVVRSGWSPWATGAETWRRVADRNPVLGVVLQDDAIVSAHFPAQVWAACRAAFGASTQPNPLSFYFGSGRPYASHTRYAMVEASGRGASFLTTRTLHHGVAVGLLGDTIMPAVEFGEQRNETDYAIRLGTFYVHHRIPTWYTNPSLVEHGGVGASLIHPNDDDRRRAYNWVGEGEKLTRVEEWSGPVLKVTGV